MRKYSGHTGLIGTSYILKVGFTSMVEFRKMTEPFFKDVNYKKQDIINKIDIINEKLFKKQDEIGQLEALNFLISNELNNVKKRISKMNEFPDPESDLYSSIKKYIKFFNSYNISIEENLLNIVDNFPKPFEDKTYWAMTFDEADKKKYNITPGFYFKKDYLYPFYSNSLLAHEIIHYISAKTEPHLLAMGLEDGLCEFLGSFYLNSEIFGKEEAENLIINTRFRYKNKQLMETYRDQLRQASLLYLNFGIDGLFNLIKKGRGTIKEVEKLCLRGNYNEISIEKGTWKDYVTKSANIFLTFPKNLVISPLAKYIINRLLEGDNLKSFIKDYNLRKEEAGKAIKELQDRIYVIIVNEDVVTCNSSQIYLENGSIRYEIEYSRE